MRNAPYNLRCNRNKDNRHLGIDSNMPNGNYLKRICKVFYYIYYKYIHGDTLCFCFIPSVSTFSLEETIFFS